ncbi:MAG: MmgE/PrpD family protein [Dehalococcoidia bacterium]
MDSVAVTAAIAQAVRGITYEALPADVRTIARHCLLDWFGVALAGGEEPLTRMLRAEVLDEGGAPQSTLLGHGARVSARQAALVNGAASHALDYDDVHQGMSGHPSVPVIPALLALAERRRSSGRDVMAALVAGIETECRIGAYVMPGHYTTGFHATGTLGTFGAAAACAHLMDLDEGQWLHALGIAGAQAAGLKVMFGTMCKPLHAGKAAANGLLAATLAARGFTSSEAVLEASQGFAATQTATPNADRALDGLGAGFAIRDVLFKYHAACYGTHETIEALTRLRERHGLAPDDVARISLVVPPGNLAMCNIQEPRTALEGKFSLRFTAALALAGGGTQEAAFTDGAVARPDLVAIRDRVSVAGSATASDGTEVTIVTCSGAELREKVNLNIPMTDLDAQWSRLTAKFRSLAAPVVGPRAPEDLVELVARFDEVEDVSAIVELASARALTR